MDRPRSLTTRVRREQRRGRYGRLAGLRTRRAREGAAARPYPPSDAGDRPRPARRRGLRTELPGCPALPGRLPDAPGASVHTGARGLWARSTDRHPVRSPVRSGRPGGVRIRTAEVAVPDSPGDERADRRRARDHVPDELRRAAPSRRAQGGRHAARPRRRRRCRQRCDPAGGGGGRRSPPPTSRTA